MPIIDIGIAATADDGHRDDNPGFTTASLQAGQNTALVRFTFFRFDAVTIPNPARIDVAHIVLEQTGGAAGTVLTNIVGIDEDDHAAPTNNATWVTDHSAHTSASVTWDFAQSASGSVNTPSIVSVIQEIVDRAGWATTQAIGIHIDDDGSADNDWQGWEDFEDAGTAHAVLHVEYEEPSAGRMLLLGVA